ncbi:hypothetical protein CHS0354_008583 [Potamilus streckersoni]|uniref:Uncharacterized protein n=1 Tax=Potamilus streckersoni TaxID=2493646 RepID=A0AAE0T9Y5_9BIVA|nr:hypothetical protein CHS0354_008583 [Potamilus streckersoni]
MSVAHWSLHLISVLAILVFLNHLEISGHMIQYDRQGQPVHLPRRHNPQRRYRNNRPSLQQTTTTTEEPSEYEAEEGISTTSSYLYDYPTKKLGYGYDSYNSYDYQYTDSNGHGGGYDYGYGTTVEMEEQVSTTQAPRRALITPVSVRRKVRNETQAMMQSDQGGESHHSSAYNGGSKPGGSENEYSGSTRPEGSQRTIFNSASQNKGGQSNGAVSQQANNEQVQSGQVVDSTQNTQRKTQRNTPPLKLPPNGTSGKHDIQRGNSKGNQQDRVNVPSRNAEIRRGRPRQPTTPEPQDYKYSPLTKICSCMTICPYNTFNMGPCRGVVSLVSRQRRRTCCLRPEPVMRILLPLALLQNLLTEL